MKDTDDDITIMISRNARQRRLTEPDGGNICRRIAAILSRRKILAGPQSMHTVGTNADTNQYRLKSRDLRKTSDKNVVLSACSTDSRVRCTIGLVEMAR